MNMLYGMRYGKEKGCIEGVKIFSNNVFKKELRQRHKQMEKKF